jgi:Pyruvate/2-oxoacid:ferredoxin oxidoreductase delta subunit
MERRNLSNLRLSELFNIAKSLDIKYIRKYNKADLIKAIIKAEEQLHKEIKNGKKSIMPPLRNSDSVLMSEANSEIFSFDDDLFAEPRKKRVRKIKCDICGKYIKSTRMQLHKEKENQKNLKTFQFDDDIFAKPKKNRVKKIKCDMCGTYIEETRIHLHICIKT